MTSFRQVVALTRGLTILRLVNEEPQATVGSIHAKSGIDKATVVRMLETLEAEGYVTRHPEGPCYRPTGKTLLLSDGYVAHRETGRLAGPVLAANQETLKWPASLAIFDRDAMIIAETTHDWRAMAVSREPNHRAPMLATSLGRAYMAHMEAEDRAYLVEVLARNPVGWNVMVTRQEELETILTQVRSGGYALADPGYLSATFNGDIWAMSVPVMGARKLYGALGLMVLRRVITPDEGIPDLVSRLKAVAPRIADALGG